MEWEKDTISMSDKNRQYSFRYADTIYEDESNRIIGFNPDEQIVYLYSVENNTISMKNIEDGSETVIDVLGDYDKIEFEWEDSKLYLRCTKDENETFGGCYDFGEEDEPGEMAYSFENTMYGTLGPERTVWDEEANEAMKEAVRKQEKK